MSKPRAWWWMSVKAAIRMYPQLVEKSGVLKTPRVTRAVETYTETDAAGRSRRCAYYGSGGSGGNARQVEQIALRNLPHAEQQALDAVQQAIELTELLPDGRDRMKVISRYYWQGNLLETAAFKAHVSERTAKTWNGDFVRTVARLMGYI